MRQSQDSSTRPQLYLTRVPRVSRIAQTTAALTGLKPVSNDMSISFSSKIRLMRSLVTSLFLYACESWTLTAGLQRRIRAMEMRCYREILHISYKDHVTNEEVRAKIQQANGPHEDLLTTAKRCKLQWYGHVSRSSGLVVNHLARHSGRWKTTSQTKIQVGRQHQGMDRTGVRQILKDSGQRCEVICSTPTTPAVK